MHGPLFHLNPPGAEFWGTCTLSSWLFPKPLILGTLKLNSLITQEFWGSQEQDPLPRCIFGPTTPMCSSSPFMHTSFVGLLSGPRACSFQAPPTSLHPCPPQNSLSEEIANMKKLQDELLLNKVWRVLAGGPGHGRRCWVGTSWEGCAVGTR